MGDLAIPIPSIKQRVREQAIEEAGIKAGLEPILARIIAARPLNRDLPILNSLCPKLSQLSTPHNMVDMDKAAKRLARAIIRGEFIGIETDHDCDGQTSHAVLYYNLSNRFGHPKEKIRSYIGHRLTEGYGLSAPVAARILKDDPRVTVLITADNGSSDEERIKQLKDNGIEVIITDHHEIPLEGYPKSAYACLNPTRSDCDYGDPYIAGCMVAWLLMTATRKELIEQNYLPKDTKTLLDSLDFVAVGTIADCVSMARSFNNRAIVAYGLRLIALGERPCWRAILSEQQGPIRSEDLAFRVGPLLNSDGRLNTAFGSVSFLLSETDREAKQWIENLRAQNTERKAIQRDIVSQGLIEANRQILQEDCFSLCIFLPEGHTGVHGIAASRIKECFGRPTVFFAPKVGQDDLLSGSVRGIDDFHVRQALQMVSDENPDMLISFGGHKGAGGLTIRKQDLLRFRNAFEKATRLQLDPNSVGPVIWTDGELLPSQLNLALVDRLADLEPFGREFEAPIFEIKAKLQDLRFVGDGTHARVVLKTSETLILKGVWFSARSSTEVILPVKINDNVKVAFQVKANYFQNNRTLDIHIVQMLNL